MKHLYLLATFLMGLVSCENNPKVIIETNLGNIVCELYDDEAPITVANFLRYVDDSRYNGSVFYRVVTLDNQPDQNIKIEVIQGGLFADNHSLMHMPIKHESTQQTGLLHADGTISMARMEPGSACSEFFICIGEQPELDFGGQRNSDGQGFAAFGKVTKGMEVVRKIHSLNTTNQMLNKNVVIESIDRL